MPNLLNRIRRLTFFAVFCVAWFNAAAGRPFEIEAYFPSYERLRASRAVTPER